MTSKAKQRALSRRTPAAHGSSRSTVRDRLWIFTVYAGGDHDHLEKGGIRGESRMTPAEGAFYLNVPNLLFIRAHDTPPLPYNQTVWRTRTEFDQYAISFRPLDRVLWSVVGSGGAGSLNELPYVLELAKKFPNIAGIFMDDFIIDAKKQADGRVVGKPVLQPSDLNKVHEQIKSTDKSMEIWITLYTHGINPQRKTASPDYYGCEPPLTDFLDLFDVLTLWTWNSDELTELDENLVALEKIAPKKARIALGLYMWDYHNNKPVPVNLMKHQCELGLKWLQEGRIHEMIFLANTVLDIGLESAEFAREWIARVGNQPVQEKRTTGT